MDIDTPARIDGSDEEEALSGNQDTGKEGEEGQSEPQEDYMELYVQKELKDKLEPIDEAIAAQKESIETIQTKAEILEAEIARVDKHYNDVIKAILTKQGVVLQEINEYNILKEYGRIAYKESKVKERMRLRRDQSSISPSGRDGSPKSSLADHVTGYVKKLGPIAELRLKKAKQVRAQQNVIDLPDFSKAVKRNTLCIEANQSFVQDCRATIQNKARELVQKLTVDSKITNNDSVQSPGDGYNTCDQRDANKLEMASESMLQSTMLDMNTQSQIEGGSQYIYEQFNEDAINKEHVRLEEMVQPTAVAHIKRTQTNSTNQYSTQ